MEQLDVKKTRKGIGQKFDLSQEIRFLENKFGLQEYEVRHERHLPRGSVEQTCTIYGRESDVISGVNTLGATSRIFLLPQPSGAFNYPHINTEIGSSGGNRQDKLPTEGGAHTCV